MITVTIPLTLTPNPEVNLLAEMGKTEALDRAVEGFYESSSEAIAHATDLLDDGYTLIFRERVTTTLGDSLILFFHKAKAPTETAEQTAIKEAFRIYQAPLQKSGAGDHPDTLRLNAIIKSLMRSGILPDDTPPVTDDTQIDIAQGATKGGSR